MVWPVVRASRRMRRIALWHAAMAAWQTITASLLLVELVGVRAAGIMTLVGAAAQTGTTAYAATLRNTTDG